MRRLIFKVDDVRRSCWPFTKLPGLRVTFVRLHAVFTSCCMLHLWLLLAKIKPFTPHNKDFDQVYVQYVYVGLQHVSPLWFTESFIWDPVGWGLPQQTGLGEVTIAEKWVKLTLKCFAVGFFSSCNVEINWNVATPQTSSSEREISLWWKWTSKALRQDKRRLMGFKNMIFTLVFTTSYSQLYKLETVWSFG